MCIRNIIRERRRDSSTLTTGTNETLRIAENPRSRARPVDSQQFPAIAAPAQCLGPHHQGLQRRSGRIRRLRRLAHLEADRPPRHSRISISSLRKRIEQDFGGARAGGGAFALSLAGPGRRGRAESGGAGFDAEAAQEASARSDHRGNELRARRTNARESPRFPSATA